MLSAASDKKYAIQSVENALDVLEALGELTEEFRISHLCQRLNLDKIKIFRLLATFQRRGYVEKEREGEYRLGARAYETGQKLLGRLSLLQKAKPVMEGLAWKCNEAVYLGIRKQGAVLLLEMVDCLQQVKVVSLVGQCFPLQTVAAGKVFLAEEGDRGGFTSAPTDSCIADRGVLGPGIASLSLPLRDGSGRVCGSLCLVGPEFRFDQERIERELCPSLTEGGEVISYRLGFSGHYRTRCQEGDELLSGMDEVSARGGYDRASIIL